MAHSEANYNINNLKYIYKSEDDNKEKDWNLKDKFIQEIYPPIGIRKFNTIDSKE